MNLEKIEKFIDGLTWRNIFIVIGILIFSAVVLENIFSSLLAMKQIGSISHYLNNEQKKMKESQKVVDKANNEISNSFDKAFIHIHSLLNDKEGEKKHG